MDSLPGMYIGHREPHVLPSYKNFVGKKLTEMTVAGARNAVDNLRDIADHMRQFVWVELGERWYEMAYETSNEALSNAQGIIRLVNANLWRHHRPYTYEPPRGLLY